MVVRSRLKRTAGRKKVERLKKLEIVVWVHPETGMSDYKKRFETVKDAEKWSKENQGNPKYAMVEEPLVEYGEYEMYPSVFKRKFPKIKLP